MMCNVSELAYHVEKSCGHPCNTYMYSDPRLIYCRLIGQTVYYAINFRNEFISMAEISTLSTNCHIFRAPVKLNRPLAHREVWFVWRLQIIDRRWLANVVQI